MGAKKYDYFGKKLLILLVLFQPYLLHAHDIEKTGQTLPKSQVVKEPFRFSYHGVLVDEKLREIEITPRYLEAAFDFYIRKVLRVFEAEALVEYEIVNYELFNTNKFGEFDRVRLRAVLVENLLENAIEKKTNDEKNTAVNETLLRWQRKTAALRLQIPKAFSLQPLNRKELEAKLNQISPEVLEQIKKYIESQRLNRIGVHLIGQFIVWDVDWLFPPRTPYIGDCKEAGVPIPPDWGDTDWNEVGTLENEFIDTDSTAIAYLFESSSPAGACVALPRINEDETMVDVFGIICLGIESENACFWDRYDTTMAEYNSEIKLEEFISGADFTGAGGNCASCHAGENPFVIHPNANVAGTANITVDWHNPLLPASWPNNPGPTNLASDTSFSNADWYNPFSWFSGTSDGRSCAQCHQLPDVGHSALRLEGYCDLVLAKAAELTMPPSGGAAGWGSSNSSDFQVHIEQLYEMCN